MVFDPFVGWGDSNTKLAIIHILNKYEALSAKKIHTRLKKEFGLSVSYQAAHKALKKMLNNNILILKRSDYAINQEWVLKMSAFIDDLEKSPDTIKEVFRILDAGKVYNFTAKSEAEMGYFFLDMVKHYVQSGGKGPIIGNFFFVWTIFPLKDEQFIELQKVIKNNGIYIVSQENFFWDKTMKKHWEDVGAKVAIGKPDCVSFCDVIVFGDYIMNIYWNAEHLQIVVEDNKKMKNEGDFNYNEVYDIINAPTDIDFTLIKNKEVAEKIRKKSLSYFD